ncbi:unnamed protein product [Durusdinium trenchii]|uniref:Uncharacterized protein n=1 Tax=Durusdinium trenchii TaxID=1381693 RepID=A0ABP0QBV2_9DINO
MNNALLLIWFFLGCGNSWPCHPGFRYDPSQRCPADLDSGGGGGVGLVQVGSQAIKVNGTTGSMEVAPQVVKHLAILQTASGSTAFAKSGLGTSDSAVVLLGMVCILVIFLIAGSQNGSSQETGESRLQNFYQRATSWVMPRLEALQEVLPCISTNLVGPSADMPLLIPIKALEEREKLRKTMSRFAGWSSPELPQDVAWQFDITSMYGKKVLAVQQMKFQDGQYGPIQVLGYSGSGKGKCLGSIDRRLQLLTGEGAEFGRLVRKQSGAYELKESDTGRHRWLVQANMKFHGHEYFTVTWRPRRRLLSTVNRGEDQLSEYMKVMPTPGVDVVLVVLCCIGLFVFRIDAQEQAAEVPEADPEDAEGSGLAGQLLASAD